MVSGTLARYLFTVAAASGMRAVGAVNSARTVSTSDAITPASPSRQLDGKTSGGARRQAVKCRNDRNP